MDFIGLIIWFAGLIYFTLCIAIQKIRPYHRNSDKKFGLITCLGATMFFWGPTLTFISIAIGVLDEEYFQACFLFVVLGVAVAFAGFIIDKHE